MKNKDLIEETRFLNHPVMIERSEEEEKSVKISGYAAKFNVLSEFMGGVRERIMPGAFDDVLNDDVRMVINHDGVPLARTKSGTLLLSVDDTGLRYEFTPSESQASKDIQIALDRGDIDQSSFRFLLERKDFEYVESEEEGLIREISKIRSLKDVSIVTFPAYPDATAEMQRSLEDYKGKAEVLSDDQLRAIKSLDTANRMLAEL